jgi:hypothetical protein
MDPGAWHTDDLEKLLAWLRGRGSDRKFRLYACACARRVWPFLTDERSRAVVEVAERQAAGVATLSDLVARRNAAHAVVQAAAHSRTASGATRRAACAAEAAAFTDAWQAARETALRTLDTLAQAAAGEVPGRDEHGQYPGWPGWAARHRAAWYRQAPLLCRQLRCVFGDPFVPAAADPAWLAWQGGTVPRLARMVHDEQAFERMPILADALEEAGCADAAILDHCRQPAEHVRGCWVLDLLLEWSDVCGTV